MELNRIIEIDFMRLLKQWAAHLKWVILTTLLFLIIGVLVALFAVDDADVYDAKSSVYSIAYGSYSESADGIQVIRTYSKIIKSYQIAERAALLLGDDSLDQYKIYDMIEVEDTYIDTSTGVYEDDSAIINIHAYSTNQEEAIRVVNAVASAYVLEVNSITKTDCVQVLDQASSCTRTYFAMKQQLMCMAVFAAAGFLVSSMIILLLEIFSTKINTIKQGTLYGELEIIGVIPEYGSIEAEREKNASLT